MELQHAYDVPGSGILLLTHDSLLLTGRVVWSRQSSTSSPAGQLVEAAAAGRDNVELQQTYEVPGSGVVLLTHDSLWLAYHSFSGHASKQNQHCCQSEV